MRWLPAVLLVACYSARPQAGVACDPTAPACPSGQACLASDGAFACLPPDTVTGDAASDGVDAASIDAPSFDASIDAPTCTATGLVCNQPGGQVATSACNGGCWAVCRDKLSRSSAAARCAAWGGVLAPIEDVVDTTCVATMSSDNLWFGAIQAPDQVLPTAGWSWNATIPLAIGSTNWTAGEPNDLDDIEDNEENCATFNAGGSGTWSDRPCSNTHAFVCRR